jgi:hypothetical protein
MSAWDITGSIVWGLLTIYLWGTAWDLKRKPDALGTNQDAALLLAGSPSSPAPLLSSASFV